MRRIIIESPFKGPDEATIERNRVYLTRCIRDALVNHQDSPYASHRLLTEALDDTDSVERAMGIKAGFDWRSAAEATVFYMDYGMSSGMHYGLLDAKRLRASDLGLHPDKAHGIEYRTIGLNP